MDTSAPWELDTQLDIPPATVWAFHAFPRLITTQQELCDLRHPSPTHTYYQCPSVLSRKVMWPPSASRVGGGEADWTCSLLGGQPQLYGRKRSYHKACKRSAEGSAEHLDGTDLCFWELSREQAWLTQCSGKACSTNAAPVVLNDMRLM